MSLDAPLHLRSARCQLDHLRAGEVSAEALLDLHLEHIRRHDPEINAVVVLDEKAARAQAREIDRRRREGDALGRLAGLPMTVKDTISTRGMKTSYGMGTNAKFVPSHDAAVIRRVRDEDAIIFGKTNVPMACMDWQCKSPIYGPTRNPWDLERAPGGSSGGAAAALCMGFTPLEIGTDVGGSIRYPAHCCGVWALKPGVHTISGHRTLDPRQPDMMRGLVWVGPMARNPGDLQLLFEVLSGQRVTDVGEVEPTELRVAWCRDFGKFPLSRAYAEVFDRFVSVVAGCVGSCEPNKAPDLDIDELLSDWGRIQGYAVSQAMPYPLSSWPVRALASASRFLVRALGPSPFTRGYHRGLAASARANAWAQSRRDRATEDMAGFLEAIDLWITPVAVDVALAHQACGAPIPVDGRHDPYSESLSYYAMPFNHLDHPVLVMPIGLTDAGMPVGVQLHVRRGREAFLLKAAEALAKLVDLDGLCPKAKTT